MGGGIMVEVDIVGIVFQNTIVCSHPQVAFVIFEDVINSGGRQFTCVFYLSEAFGFSVVKIEPGRFGANPKALFMIFKNGAYQIAADGMNIVDVIQVVNERVAIEMVFKQSIVGGSDPQHILAIAVNVGDGDVIFSVKEVFVLGF